MKGRPHVLATAPDVTSVALSWPRLGPLPPPPALHPRPAPRCLRLRDGAFVSLRPSTANDEEGLRAMFYTLSDTTRYLYFGAGIPETEAWAARTASLGIADGIGSYAMVARADGQTIGFARFVRNRQGADADLGILLTDAWQSRGLGREVLAFLRAEAESDNWALCGFTTVVLGENRRAMRLLRRAFPDLRAELSGGQFSIAMPFESSQPVA